MKRRLREMDALPPGQTGDMGGDDIAGTTADDLDGAALNVIHDMTMTAAEKISKLKEIIALAERLDAILNPSSSTADDTTDTSDSGDALPVAESVLALAKRGRTSFVESRRHVPLQERQSRAQAELERLIRPEVSMPKDTASFLRQIGARR